MLHTLGTKPDFCLSISPNWRCAYQPPVIPPVQLPYSFPSRCFDCLFCCFFICFFICSFFGRLGRIRVWVCVCVFSLLSHTFASQLCTFIYVSNLPFVWVPADWPINCQVPRNVQAVRVSTCGSLTVTDTFSYFWLTIFARTLYQCCHCMPLYANNLTLCCYFSISLAFAALIARFSTFVGTFDTSPAAACCMSTLCCVCSKEARFIFVYTHTYVDKHFLFLRLSVRLRARVHELIAWISSRLGNKRGKAAPSTT